MRSNYNSRWHDADTYRAVFLGNPDGHSQKASMLYREGEVTRELRPDKYFTDEEVDALIEAGKIDSLCAEIVCRVAASKYLTLFQLVGYLTRQGVNYSMNDVNKRMRRLVQCRFLRIMTCKLDRDITLKCYCLGFNGHQLAAEAGVPMHRGNQYMTLKRKLDLGLPQEEEPYEIKRILVANQIILSLFGSGVQLQRFGLMETLTLPSEAHNGSLVRTTCNIYLDAEDTLMCEIVRRMPQWQEKLVNKVRRFAKTVYSPLFGQENSWGLSSRPQLVLCGESQEHNREIYTELKNAGLFGDYPELDVLFTSDGIVKQAPEKLYAFDENGGQIWYELPVQTDGDARAA